LKILLIYPYFLNDRPDEAEKEVRAIPIGLYYIGALLKDNQYDVEILNWYNINKTPERIGETLLNRKPDVIGVSIVHANRWGGIEIARLAKRILPDAKIVFGGVGTTFLWEHLLRHFPEIDYAVLGEGEYSFLNLIRCMEKETFEEIKTIKGIAFRRGQTIIKTDNAETIRDIDQLPMPSKYFEFQYVMSSRGCPSNCTFCGSPKLWGRKVRFHSAGYFAEQLEQLYLKGITHFFVSDDTFTIKKDRVIEICKKIMEKELKITWFALSRVNHVDEEMLYWMRKAGCIQISYGVESGSEKIREIMNKNIKTEDIRRAFALTGRYGIVARAYFIYGAQGESWETIQESIDLIHQIKPLIVIFYPLALFPGTGMYEDFKRRTQLTDDIWLERIEDIQYFDTDPLLSKDIVAAFGQKLYSDYHLHISGFIDAIELIDQKDLYESHAQFLSTLAENFGPGGFFSAIPAIPGKEETVRRLYEKALSYFPLQKAYSGLGIITQKQGKYEESVRILSEGIKQYPESASLAVSLGISHMNMGHLEEATEQYLIALRLDPDNLDAHFNLADVYMQKGLIDKAIEQYLIILKIRPDQVGAHNNLANAYMFTGSIDEAIEQYNAVIALQDNHFDAHCNIGIAYLHKGLIDKAEEHYDVAIRLNSDNADAHFNFGLIYQKKGNKEKALKEYKEALRLNPDLKEARDCIVNLNR